MSEENTRPLAGTFSSSDTDTLSPSENARFLQRQMQAWLFTFSFPAYCALIRLLLSRCGYATVRALNTQERISASGRRYSGEGGLDLLAFAHTDLTTFVSAVGIKTGRIPLGRRYVDELRGAVSRVGAEQGLLFTTATISHKTREVAEQAGLPPVHLFDGEALAGLLIERRIGVQSLKGMWVFDSSFFEALDERTQQNPERGRGRRL